MSEVRHSRGVTVSGRHRRVAWLARAALGPGPGSARAQGRGCRSQVSGPSRSLSCTPRAVTRASRPGRDGSWIGG